MDDAVLIERAAELVSEQIRQRLRVLEQQNDKLHRQVKALLAEKRAASIGANDGSKD